MFLIISTESTFITDTKFTLSKLQAISENALVALNNIIYKNIKYLANKLFNYLNHSNIINLSILLISTK